MAKSVVSSESRLCSVTGPSPSRGAQLAHPVVPQVRLPARPGRLLCELCHRLGLHWQRHGAAAAARPHPLHLPHGHGQDCSRPQEHQAGTEAGGGRRLRPRASPPPAFTQPPAKCRALCSGPLNWAQGCEERRCKEPG